jgi:hypothetical protein
MPNEDQSSEMPDFARGLSVSDKVGKEFAAVGSSGALVSLVMTQGFAMLFIVPVVVFFGLRNLAGVAVFYAGLVSGVLGLVVVILGIVMLRSVNRSDGGTKGGGFFRDESDSRYRVRAVIPPKRRSARVMRWVEAAVHAEMRDEEPVRADELEMVRGGFDPIIVRPWFGIKRGRAFWWTAVVCGLVCSLAMLQLLSLIMGGWGAMLKSSGMMGYAMTGAAMVSGLVCAELIWPVYVRLVPGRLDVFRYGFLGSGRPEVETHDLKLKGVCVDFGSYTIAIEPERPAGEPLPALVQAKRWPHGQTLPEGYMPRYVCVALVVGRRELAQRVIQAARTDEATPGVSETELGG